MAETASNDAPSYAHRADPKVPAFDDEGLRVVMDAHCALCARGARWIARNDREDAFRIIPVQSPLGAALLAHYGLEPEDPVSWLFLEDGRPAFGADAAIRAGRRLGGVWRGLAALRIVPSGVLERAYRLVARNRIRWFGRADLCAAPDPAVRRRLILS